MNVPPALFFLLLPAAIVIGWLYLHANADVEQRINVREAQHMIDSASIDKDFARIAGDKAGEEAAQKRIAAAEQQLQAAVAAREARAKTDERVKVRSAVDQLINNPQQEKRK